MKKNFWESIDKLREDKHLSRGFFIIFIIFLFLGTSLYNMFLVYYPMGEQKLALVGRIGDIQDMFFMASFFVLFIAIFFSGEIKKWLTTYFKKEEEYIGAMAGLLWGFIGMFPLHESPLISRYFPLSILKVVNLPGTIALHLGFQFHLLFLGGPLIGLVLGVCLGFITARLRSFKQTRLK